MPTSERRMLGNSQLSRKHKLRVGMMRSFLHLPLSALRIHSTNAKQPQEDQASSPRVGRRLSGGQPPQIEGCLTKWRKQSLWHVSKPLKSISVYKTSVHWCLKHVGDARPIACPLLDRLPARPLNTLVSLVIHMFVDWLRYVEVTVGNYM